MRTSLEEKNLLFYFNDNSIQKEFERLGWAGRIFNIRCLNVQGDCQSDYLGLFESNFGVNKANFFVNKTISIDKKIITDGKVITDLTLNYQNQSQSGLLEGGQYTNYLRIFIPKNSTFISSSFDGKKIELSQFDIANYQDDKAVYGITLKIPENSSAVFKMSYHLNDQLSDDTRFYQFYFQKQPGDKVSSVNLSYVSSKYMISPYNFNSQKGESSSFVYSTETSVDRIFQFKLTL